MRLTGKSRRARKSDVAKSLFTQLKTKNLSVRDPAISRLTSAWKMYSTDITAFESGTQVRCENCPMNHCADTMHATKEVEEEWK